MKKVILDPNKSNTKLCLKSLGTVKLKYISYGDTRDFLKILQKPLSDRNFVIEILYHQLIKPKIKFDKFKKLSDKEIEKLAKVFVKKEDCTFKHFQGTGNFFKDFRQTIQIKNEKYFEELRKTFEPILKSTQETLAVFHKDYAPVIQQALDASSYIQDTMRQFSSATQQFQKTRLEIIGSVKPIIEQYNTTARILTESIGPQIEIWQKWAKQNNSVFKDISKLWSEFQKRYKVSEKKAVGILQKYKWFISPSMPINFIFKVVQLEQKKGRQDKAINKFFIDYFSRNDWQNLEAITKNWERKSLFKKRIKIIQDCIKTLKNADRKTNAVNVVLPTLITQIDGVLTDYLNLKGIHWDCDYDDWVDRNTGRVIKIGRKTQFKNVKPKVLTTQLDDLASDIFLNILFQHSQKGAQLKTPFNFNRHKIIHGENVRYGRQGYLIRAFLILDFLVHLH